MRLYKVLILLLFVFVFNSCLCQFLGSTRRLEANLDKVKRETNSKRFIAESFRNTCNGTGFSDLEEWQLVCRSLFRLEYIAWCNAEEFMVDTEKGGTLFYGKWVSEDAEMNGEVYCRDAGAFGV